MPAEFPVIAIGASAGALDAVRYITEALPRDCAAAIAVVFQAAFTLHLVITTCWWRRQVASASFADYRFTIPARQ